MNGLVLDKKAESNKLRPSCPLSLLSCENTAFVPSGKHCFRIYSWKQRVAKPDTKPASVLMQGFSAFGTVRNKFLLLDIVEILYVVFCYISTNRLRRCLFVCILFWEQGLANFIQAGLELTIFLPQPPQHWDYGHTPAHLAQRFGLFVVVLAELGITMGLVCQVSTLTLSYFLTH